MFTRLVECHAKPGKREEVTSKVRNEVLASLQKQPGFVDLIALRDGFHERLLCLSFWNSQEDADRFHRDNYDRILSLLKPLLSSDPIQEGFHVDASTAHRIDVGEAVAGKTMVGKATAGQAA